MEPRAIVIGLGSYFRKLYEGIREQFPSRLFVDHDPTRSHALLSDDFASFYTGIDPRNPNVILSNCALILTPPGSHLGLLDQLSGYSNIKAVLVEKPLVTSLKDIERVENAGANLGLLYCSDFYPDVRATPLIRWALEAPTIRDPELEVNGPDAELWHEGMESFGSVVSIEGRLVENEIEGGSVNDRPWLLDPTQGGVLLDLLYHYLTILHVMWRRPLTITQSKLRTVDEAGTVVRWEKDGHLAETYAAVRGTLGHVPFWFEVSKLWPARTERYYRLRFPRGTATMHFGRSNVLRLERNGKSCVVILKGDYYLKTVARFVAKIKSGTQGVCGLESARAALASIDEIRQHNSA